MMDLVLNHSSHLHPWFLEARKDRNNKYHDFYIWKEGTKEQPPEGGGAFFRGSTWEWVPEVQEICLLPPQFQCNAAGSELEKSVASERAVPDDPVLDG